MVFALQSVNFLDKVVIGLVAVPMMAELNLTPVQFGIVGGSVFWLFSVGGVLGGFLSNRVPSRLILIGMAVLWSLAQIPVAVTSSLIVLVVARAILGFGEGPSAAVGMHAMYKWFPDDKRNLPSALSNAGSAFGVIIAGLTIPLITAHWGWRANFWVLAIAGFVWVAIWWLVGAEGPLDNTTPDKKSEAADIDSAVTSERAPYRKLLMDPTILCVFLMHFAAYWMVAIALTWVPAYLEKGWGFSAHQSGRLFALMVVISTLITFLVVGFSQRRLKRGASSRSGRVLVACFAMLASGLLFASLKFIPYTSTQAIVVFMIANGFSIALFSFGPVLVSEVVPPAQRGAVLGIEFAVFGSVPGILAPLVMGVLLEGGANPLSEYNAGFAWSGLLLMVAGVVCLLLMHPERSQARLRDAVKRVEDGDRDRGVRASS